MLKEGGKIVRKYTILHSFNKEAKSISPPL